MSCKVCVRCKESKPIEDYHSAGHYNSKGERYSRASCKKCTLKVKRNRNVEKLSEYVKRDCMVYKFQILLLIAIHPICPNK